MAEMIEKIIEICSDIYENEDKTVVADTDFKELSDWDSLTQINLVVALEATFKVKFDLVS